jgi:hypothetical protein
MKAYLKETYGIEHSKDIPKANYEAICAWAEGKTEDVQIDCPVMGIGVGLGACRSCKDNPAGCEPYQTYLDSKRGA